MKNLIKIIMVLVVFTITGCDYEISAEKQQSQQTQQLQAEAQKQIGMPSIVNFQERKLMKQIIELRDREDLICYAYITTLNGDLVFLGKCIGYGLPYSVQYTNPEQVYKVYQEGITLPQADPNGLYMPQGLSATWLMLIDPNTNIPRPVYVEPEILVSPFPLK